MNHLEDLDVGGVIILKMDLKCSGSAWTGLILLRAGKVAGCCEHGNELHILRGIYLLAEEISAYQKSMQLSNCSLPDVLLC